MASDSFHSLHQRGQSLEEEFFRQQDAKLVEKLRELKRIESTRELLSRATGITNKERLDKLMELQIGSETAAVLTVLPLVEIAWADGQIDAKERAHLMEHAKSKGFVAGTSEHALLETWLQKRPEPRLFVAWLHMIHGLCEDLNATEAAHLKGLVMERARAMAGASGGILGIGKVSASEAALLAKIEKAFDRKG